MKNRAKGFNKMIYIIATIVLLALFCVWQNNSIVVSSSDYYSSRIAAGFDDFRIVHISDLHNKMFGKKQSRILSETKSLSPDIIVITGDLIDRRRFDLDAAMCFIDGAVKLAPIYYVPGNHEAWSGKYSQIKQRLIEAGVYVLDDAAVEISKGSASMQLLGLSDPGFITSEHSRDVKTGILKERLEQWTDCDQFKLLLTHRPELFDLYCENNIDLIFAGHAHGGQFRVPFAGGLFAPDQGVFPRYASGSHSSGSSTMFVSRGLGNSLMPIRIFNRPEIVAVTLKSAE